MICGLDRLVTGWAFFLETRSEWRSSDFVVRESLTK